MIFIEWDRLLVPGGLIVQRGAWANRKTNAEMAKLFEYAKYLMEKVLQWKVIDWKVAKDKYNKGKLTMSFTASKPQKRELKSWSQDTFLRQECPACFTATDAFEAY